MSVSSPQQPAPANPAARPNGAGPKGASQQPNAPNSLAHDSSPQQSAPAAQPDYSGVAGWNGAGQPVDSSGNVIAGGPMLNSAPAGVTPTMAPPPAQPQAQPTQYAGTTMPARAPANSQTFDPNNPPYTSMPYADVLHSLNLSGVPGLVGGDALRQAQLQQQNAAYNQATAYLDPQFANEQRDLQTQLVNQGIPQGSEAWNRAMDEFNRTKTFAYNQAEQGAVGQGNALENQLFGQGLAANQNAYGQALNSGQFTNSAEAQLAQQILGSNALSNSMQDQNFNHSMAMRNQDINELLLQQQNPLTTLNELLSGNSVQSPNFAQTPNSNVGGTDIASIINAYMGQQNNAYNAQMGGYNSGLSGLGMLGAAALMAPSGGFLTTLLSDERAKTDIKKVGETDEGVPIHTYRYKGSPTTQMGVLAQELRKFKPDAVAQRPDGLLAVDYRKVT